MRFTAEIKFGTLAAVGMAAWTLLAWRLGWHDRDFTHAQYGKHAWFVMSVGAMVLAARARRTRQTGWLEFGEAFQTATVTCAIAAFLNGAFAAFYGRALNPGWLARAWEWQKAGLIAAGKKETELNRPEAIANASQTLLFQLLMDPIGKVLIGLVFAVAIAALLRRKAPETEPSAS